MEAKCSTVLAFSMVKMWELKESNVLNNKNEMSMMPSISNDT